MKKNISALLLALCLLLTALPAAQAAQSPGFVRQRTYAGEFSDLTAASPFYSNVAALYEYGLANGKADGTFGLQDPLTVGQVVIFAGRVRSLYQDGDPESGPSAYGGEGGPAALPYLRYLQAEGVLDTELDSSLSDNATRAQVAHVLNRVLPEEALPIVYDELVTQGYASRRRITDVNEGTPYWQDILDLYRKGVSAGNDARGTYQPDAPITRGAAAAMLTRMVDPSLRVQPSWDLDTLYSAVGTTLASLVESKPYIPSPSNQEELESSVCYMLSQGSNQLVLHYPSVSTDTARQLMSGALSVIKDYCEQGYNEVRCTRGNGTVTLTFTAAGANGRTEEYRAAAMEAAIAVHDQLWKEGALRLDMTDLEKARVYYGWICDNCVYDFKAGDSSISHVPYSLFANHTAVCDGYTGAYNLFLKLEGISCGTYINADHIWSVAILDGTEYHIDTTWGDSGSAVSYDYFAMTPQQSLAIHTQRAG